jgi:hypothetical protein
MFQTFPDPHKEGIVRIGESFLAGICWHAKLPTLQWTNTHTHTIHVMMETSGPNSNIGNVSSNPFPDSLSPSPSPDCSGQFVFQPIFQLIFAAFGLMPMDRNSSTYPHIGMKSWWWWMPISKYAELPCGNNNLTCLWKIAHLQMIYTPMEKSVYMITYVLSLVTA